MKETNIYLNKTPITTETLKGIGFENDTQTYISLRFDNNILRYYLPDCQFSINGNGYVYFSHIEDIQLFINFFKKPL